MVCVCINSCYLHADRGVCVNLDTPPGVSVLHEGVCTHHVEAHKCLCVFEHICTYKSVFLCNILFLYGFISRILQCFPVWSLGVHVRLFRWCINTINEVPGWV